MYITGFFGLLIVVLAVLLMLAVIPMTPVLIGGMFLLTVLAVAGPFVVKTVP